MIASQFLRVLVHVGSDALSVVGALLMKGLEVVADGRHRFPQRPHCVRFGELYSAIMDTPPDHPCGMEPPSSAVVAFETAILSRTSRTPAPELRPGSGTGVSARVDEPEDEADVIGLDLVLLNDPRKGLVDDGQAARAMVPGRAICPPAMLLLIETFQGSGIGGMGNHQYVGHSHLKDVELGLGVFRPHPVGVGRVRDQLADSGDDLLGLGDGASDHQDAQR